MNISGLGRVWLIILFFSLLSFSAGTGFPENYFDEPLPRGIAALQAIVSTAGTELFGELGGALFFGILGTIIAWLAYRQTQSGEKNAQKRVEPISPDEGITPVEGSRLETGGQPAHVSFGRKKRSTANGEQPIVEERLANADDLPEAIYVDNNDHVNWLKEQSDAGNWHQAALSCVTYRGDPFGFLDWLLDNPATDRSTAAIIFLRFGGTEYLRTGRCRYTPIDYSSMERLLEVIHTRCELGGFSNSNFGLSTAYEEERKTCLAIIEQRTAHPDSRVPRGLLEPSFLGLDDPGDYQDIGEGDLMTQSALAKMLPQIYGPEGSLNS